MRTWLRQHRGALARAVRKLAAQRAATLLNALVIGVALSLPAGGYALLANLQSVAQRFTFEPQLSVFLRPEAKRAELEARLRADRRVAALRFVSRDEALAELRVAAGLADVVAALERNPLPDAFVVRAADGGAAALEALAGALQGLPGVANVQVDSAWAARLAALARIGRLALAALAVLLATGLVAVTFNTIRLQIVTQREEIEVSQLLGATDAFVRRPFFYFGLLQGLAGGALALVILWAGLAVLNLGVRDLAQAYGSSFQLAFLSGHDALAVVAFAALLGWLGALLSVSKHLR
ncbi:MAG: permease-like cell division protein FtsX [Betaproteobacteria bacterium]|nr:permease-like cell division protein FtsX [Betaproteobacteria bacterium]MDH5210346.1 permease-like cell division protein FtsX [Betaproteobacteria bacterium]